MKSKYEKKCQKELEADNWLVDWKIRPSGFKNPRGYNVDYFGLFDLCAIREGDIIRWISIKGHAGVPKAHREAIKAFKMPKNCIKEIWTYGKNRKVRREVIK